MRRPLPAQRARRARTAPEELAKACYPVDYKEALRAVATTDFMTATWADLPHEFLQQVSNKIINSVPEVSRVVYDISGKPPATIEWE